MKIENQVCSIEQAKKLKSLGIKGNSMLTWMYAVLSLDGDKFENVPMLYRENTGAYDLVNVLDFDKKWETTLEEDYETIGNYAAYSVAELGVMLPCIRTFNYDGYTSYINYYCLCGKFYCSIDCAISGKNLFKIHGDTEAQARSSILIWMLENKIITPEQVNKSLQG